MLDVPHCLSQIEDDWIVSLDNDFYPYISLLCLIVGVGGFVCRLIEYQDCATEAIYHGVGVAVTSGVAVSVAVASSSGVSVASGTEVSVADSVGVTSGGASTTGTLPVFSVAQ